MSKRFENGYIALAITCVSLIFAIGYVSIIFAFSEGYKSADKEHEGYYASRQAREKAYTECLESSLTVPIATSCIHNSSNASREDERAEQDLNAQREMAQWSKGMLWATLIIGMSTVIVTAVGVYWVKETLSATRDAVTAADDAVKATRDIGEAQVRAYVSIDEIEISDVPDKRGRFEARVTFKNTGQSPAWEVHHELQIVFITTNPRTQVRGDSLRLPPVVAMPGSSKAEIAAGGTYRGKAHTPFDMCDEKSPALIAAGYAVLLARGWVTYKDVFGKPHRTDYAWHRDGDTNAAGFSIIASTRGNKSG